MKLFLTWLSLLVAGASVAILCRAQFVVDSDPASVRSVSAGPTLEHLRDLSALTTLKVDVADAMATELRGHIAGVKAVLIVRGEVVIGVDLASAALKVPKSQERRAVVTLPEPSVQFARLDQERTKLLGVWTDGLWQITPGGTTATPPR